MKYHPILFNDAMVRAVLSGAKTQTRRFKVAWEPGDRLYVRERWRINAVGRWGTHDRPEPWLQAEVEYGNHERRFCDISDEQYDAAVRYFKRHRNGSFSPSIHMPRWASRITLLVKAVREERLQDITEGGVFAEGCIVSDETDQRPFVVFAALWDSIYKKDGQRWSDNPLVKVTDFEIFKEQGDE